MQDFRGYQGDVQRSEVPPLSRFNITDLIDGLDQEEMKNMTLALSHGLSRFKLKFSVEKVDTMIIQAVSLLDDLDKELNNYMMRLREWYGWHFPELSKIISDNLTYAKTVLKVGILFKIRHEVERPGDRLVRHSDRGN